MTGAEIVEALAEFQPLRPYPAGMSCQQLSCVFCVGIGPYYDPPPVFPHEEGCLWLEARRVAS